MEEVVLALLLSNLSSESWRVAFDLGMEYTGILRLVAYEGKSGVHRHPLMLP